MVGTVLVRDGEIVGEGYHREFGAAHAEVVALARAGSRARGATAYVTLEPCAHAGKTPPCSGALVAAGVARVVAAIADPHPVAAGGGDLLRGAGLAYDVGVEAHEARELNAAFLFAIRSDRPWVTLKLATSLDGGIADHRRTPGWLSGERSRQVVHHLRAGTDAIAIGVGTALADDPRLTARGKRPPRRAPVRVVFDRHDRLPLDGALARTARDTPVIVVSGSPDAARVRALGAVGIRLLRAETLSAALRALRAAPYDVRSLLVEGGAKLAGALLRDALVDRLIIFQAPVILGAGALNAFAFAPPALAGDVRRLPVVQRARLGDDLMSVFALTAL